MKMTDSEIILGYLGASREQSNTLVFEAACDYCATKFSCDNISGLNKVFWQWWLRGWARRDGEFLERLSVDVASGMVFWSGKHVARRWRLREFYVAWHKSKLKETYPDGAVIKWSGLRGIMNNNAAKK